MPGAVVEQKVGSCYVWLICISLSICLAVGGTLLALYVINPDSPSVSSYPTTGISLICLPWLFWFITILYRFLSRKFGFRMVFWGASVDALPRASTNAGEFSNNPGGREAAEGSSKFSTAS